MKEEKEGKTNLWKHKNKTNKSKYKTKKNQPVHLYAFLAMHPMNEVPKLQTMMVAEEDYLYLPLQDDVSATSCYAQYKCHNITILILF